MFDDPIRRVRPILAIQAVWSVGLRRRPSGAQLGLARRFAKRCAAKAIHSDPAGLTSSTAPLHHDEGLHGVDLDA